MATAKQLTGGTNDVNPQWWILGSVQTGPNTTSGKFNYWFFNRTPAGGCDGHHWQGTQGFDPQLPMTHFFSGDVDCANAVGVFPPLPYVVLFAEGTIALNMPIFDR